MLDLGAEASYRMMSQDFMCGPGGSRGVAEPEGAGAALGGPNSKCGSLEVAFSYDAMSARMSLAIVQARSVPPRAKPSGECLSQVGKIKKIIQVFSFFFFSLQVISWVFDDRYVIEY
jgi:hypothetical protein